MNDKPLPIKCEAPGCGCGGRLILHSRCHPDDPTWTVLDNDIALIVCSICRSVISGLRVTGLVPRNELPATLDEETPKPKLN